MHENLYYLINKHKFYLVHSILNQFKLHSSLAKDLMNSQMNFMTSLNSVESDTFLRKGLLWPNIIEFFGDRIALFDH